MKSKSTIVNTGANLLSKAWTMVANFIFVPIYIKLLGEEAYGLITFFATMQTVLNLLGLGLSKTLRREFAADDSSGKNYLYKYKIMRSVELIYWILAIVIITICFFGAHFIAQEWLNLENISVDVVIFTIQLMGVSIASQLVANLYLGCLMGLEMQVTANSYQIIWSVLKNVGVILIMMLIKSDIRLFYIWHIIIDIIYLLALRLKTVRFLRKQGQLSWELNDFSNIKKILKFAVGIMVISIGYAMNSQIDKFIISSQFTLTIVGAYNSAFNLSYVSVIFTSALGIAIFPKFAKLFSKKDLNEEKKIFSNVNLISNILTSTLGAFIAVFSYDIMLIWTGSQNVAEIVKDCAFFIMIGTTLSAIQEIPYNFFLANGITIINNIMTLCCIVYVLFITPIFISCWGVIGASVAWLIEMLIATTLYLLVFYKKFFKGEIFKKIFLETYGILIINICIAYFFKMLIKNFIDNSIITILLAGIVGIITLLIWFFIIFKKRISLPSLKKEKGEKDELST